jgi:aspartate-semialdehyde dehydrogenase
MIMPEINPDHLGLLDIQRKNRGWTKGLIAVKPNCSIQSYVSILTAWKEFGPQEVSVTSLQAISGAGKNFDTWPEMLDNVIPLIGGEEEKSEKEPMKIWGKFKNGMIEMAEKPGISATCIRVPVTNGHLASVKVRFAKKPTKKQLLAAIQNYQNPIADLKLPSAPKQLVTYFEEENRPQTKLDRDLEHGMGISMGRLEKDTQYDWKFIALSHNTIRGAAGGAILMAELLAAKGYI